MATKAISLVIGEVRFSYLHVFEPWAAEEGANKNYTATLLIPKDNAQLNALIDKAIKQAYESAVTEIWGGKRPPLKNVTPLHDGDEPKNDGTDRGEAYENHWFLNSKGKSSPGIIDRNKQPLLNPDEMYSGCYGYASIAFRGYLNNGKMGISVYLNNLMKARDGEPLGNAKTDAAADFAGVNIPAYDDDL